MRLLTCLPGACELSATLFDVYVMLVRDLIGSLCWLAFIWLNHCAFASSVSFPFTFPHFFWTAYLELMCWSGFSKRCNRVCPSSILEFVSAPVSFFLQHAASVSCQCHAFVMGWLLLHSSLALCYHLASGEKEPLIPCAGCSLGNWICQIEVLSLCKDLIGSLHFILFYWKEHDYFLIT